MTTRAVPSSRRRATSSSSSDSERWLNGSTKAGIDLLQGGVVSLIPDLPTVKKNYARISESAYLRTASYFWKEKTVPHGVKPAERRGCSTDDGGYNEAVLS
jgi:hypothetical protein